MKLWAASLMKIKTLFSTSQSWFLFFVSALSLLGRPLTEPDEARYAEIAREMVVSGDWITPHLNGVLYFEKPPFQYWISALGIQFFGANDWAPRLPMVLAICLFFIASKKITSLLHFRDSAWPTFALFTSLIGFVMSQIMTLDTFFTSLIMMALAYFFEGIHETTEGRSSVRSITSMWVFVALAFLTKGPAVIVIFAGFLLVYGVLYSDLREFIAKLRLCFQIKPFIIFLLIVIPWFWYVNQINPGHSYFFFIFENFLRYTTTVHDRQGSSIFIVDKLYFIGVLGLGLMPWLGFTLSNLRKCLPHFRFRNVIPLLSPQNAQHKYIQMLFAFSIWTLVFFSLSSSKLPPYIYPVLLPLLLIATSMESKNEERKNQKRIGWELILLSVIFSLLPWLAKTNIELNLYWLYLFVLTLLIVGLIFIFKQSWSKVSPITLLLIPWVSLILVFNASSLASSSVKPLIHSSVPGTQWISAGTYFQGISYYGQTRTIVVQGTGELRYGKERLPEEQQPLWFTENIEELPLIVERIQRETDAPIRMIAKKKVWEKASVNLRSQWIILIDNKNGNLLLKPNLPTPTK